MDSLTGGTGLYSMACLCKKLRERIQGAEAERCVEHGVLKIALHCRQHLSTADLRIREVACWVIEGYRFE